MEARVLTRYFFLVHLAFTIINGHPILDSLYILGDDTVHIDLHATKDLYGLQETQFLLKTKLDVKDLRGIVKIIAERHRHKMSVDYVSSIHRENFLPRENYADKNNEDLVSDSKYSQLPLEQIEHWKKSNITKKNQSTGNSHQEEVKNDRRADRRRFEITLIQEIYNLIREALSLVKPLPEKKKKMVEDFSDIIEDDITRYSADYHQDVKDELLNLYVDTRILHREILKDFKIQNGRKTLLATSYYLRNLIDIWRRSSISENPSVYDEIATRRNYEDFKRYNTQSKDDTTGTLNELDKSAHQEPTNRMYKQDIVANETAGRSGNSTSKQSKTKNHFDSSSFDNTINGKLGKEEKTDQIQNGRRADQRRFEIILIHEIYNLIREALRLVKTLPETKKKIVKDFSNIIEEDIQRYGADYNGDVKDGLLNLYVDTMILHREILKELEIRNGRKTLLATSYYLRNLIDIWRQSQESENPPVYDEIATKRNYDDFKRYNTQSKDDTTGTLNVELAESADQEPASALKDSELRDGRRTLLATSYYLRNLIDIWRRSQVSDETATYRKNIELDESAHQEQTSPLKDLELRSGRKTLLATSYYLRNLIDIWRRSSISENPPAYDETATKRKNVELDESAHQEQTSALKDLELRNGRRTLLATSYYLRNLIDIWRQSQVFENPPVYDEIATKRNYDDFKRYNTQSKDDTTGTLNVELDKSAHQEPTNRMYKQDIVANETAARSGFDHLRKSTSKQSNEKNHSDNSTLNNSSVSKEHSSHYRKSSKGDAKLLKDFENITKNVPVTYNNKTSIETSNNEITRAEDIKDSNGKNASFPSSPKIYGTVDENDDMKNTTTVHIKDRSNNVIKNLTITNEFLIPPRPTVATTNTKQNASFRINNENSKESKENNTHDQFVMDHILDAVDKVLLFD